MSITPDSVAFPISASTISVKIFNSFRSANFQSAPFFSAGHGSQSDESNPFVFPGKSFLLEHPSGRTVVFDLGIRKDLLTAPKSLRNAVQAGITKIDFGPDVAETLIDGGVSLESIEAVIWSHAHADHTGNPSTFPPSTALVVGPGVQAHFRPGYPLNEAGSVPESDFLGREVIEITFEEDALRIAGLKAYDYFGDGSFYLLDAPGHCVGHMIGLARTTPTSFILMGSDGAHHPALLRPSPFVPLPAALSPTIPPSLSACPHDQPFLSMPLEKNSIHHDHAQAREVHNVLIALDGRHDVFVVLSHDGSMDPITNNDDGIEFFPKTANDWMEKGWKWRMHWKFLEKGNQVYRWD